jgi:hypothetical protein
MWAFDLMELNGDDLRHDPLDVSKQTLAVLLARASRYPLEWTSGARRWSARFPSWLLARTGRHRVEAEGLALQFPARSPLDQEQEPECAGGEAGSWGRLEPIAMAAETLSFHCPAWTAGDPGAAQPRRVLRAGKHQKFPFQTQVLLTRFWRPTHSGKAVLFCRHRAIFRRVDRDHATALIPDVTGGWKRETLKGVPSNEILMVKAERLQPAFRLASVCAFAAA